MGDRTVRENELKKQTAGGCNPDELKKQTAGECNPDELKKQPADEFNPAQKEAVLHGAGPCAVIAGPGSGKTHVLVERIRYLIDSGLADPSRILVLTFSRAAAGEMRSRFLRRKQNRDGAAVSFGTMHAVFFRILQESGHEKLRLIDGTVKEKYLRHLCESRTPRGTTVEELQLLISRRKNGLPCRQPWLREILREYDAFLRNRSCLDFDDMILQCRTLLRTDPAVREHWQRRFQWLLVDEFQDVSLLQYDVLRILATPRDNLFVVGDDDQSIYGFRGADPGTMQRFLRDYQPHVHRIALNVNYRCGRNVLKASSALIRENQKRIEKEFVSGAGIDGSVRLRLFSSRNQQFLHLAGLLESMEDRELANTAVVFRTHAGAKAFLKILKDRSIAFQADAGTKRAGPGSVQETILQDLSVYYRTAEEIARGKAGKKDLLRIINRPERLLSGSFLCADRMSRGQILEHAGFDRRQVETFLEDLETLDRLSPRWSMRYLLESMGYRGWAETALSGAASGEEPPFDISVFLDRMRTEAERFSGVPEWRRYLDRERETLAEAGPSKQSMDCDPHGVHILTMHACKGLEFDTVFVPDLNEGTVPSRRALSPDQLEEERRLLYVAMTRAKKVLLLTGLEGTPDRPAALSRFLLPLTYVVK